MIEISLFMPLSLSTPPPPPPPRQKKGIPRDQIIFPVKLKFGAVLLTEKDCSTFEVNKWSRSEAMFADRNEIAKEKVSSAALYSENFHFLTRMPFSYSNVTKSI